MRTEKNASVKIAHIKPSTERFKNEMVSRLNDKISGAALKIQKAKQDMAEKPKKIQRKIAEASPEVMEVYKEIVSGKYLQ